jgi:hypothetical protein
VLQDLIHPLITATGVIAVVLRPVDVLITAEATTTPIRTAQADGQAVIATATLVQRIRTTRVLATANRGVIAGEHTRRLLAAMTVATTGTVHRSSRKAIAVRAMNRVEAKTATRSLRIAHQDNSRSLLTALLLHHTRVVAAEVEVAHPVVVAVTQVVAQEDPGNPFAY